MKYFSNIVRNLKFYFLTQKYKWMEMMTYRTQMISWVFIESIGTASIFISISVIYTVSNGLPGWTYFQLLALAGMTQITTGFLYYLINPYKMVNSMRDGGIDQLLLKPYNSILNIFATYGDTYGIGNTIPGFVLLAYALTQIKFNIAALLVYIPTYIVGVTVLVFAILTITLVSYIKIKSGNYIGRSINVALNAAEYPISIYGIMGITLLSLVVPVAFASFFPVMVLLGKINFVDAGLVILIASTMVTLFYIASTHLLKYYESGGG